MKIGMFIFSHPSKGCPNFPTGMTTKRAPKVPSEVQVVLAGGHSYPVSKAEGRGESHSPGSLMLSPETDRVLIDTGGPQGLMCNLGAIRRGKHANLLALGSLGLKVSGSPLKTPFLLHLPPSPPTLTFPTSTSNSRPGS